MNYLDSYFIFESNNNFIYNWISLTDDYKSNIYRLQNILINGVKFRSNDDLKTSIKYPYSISTTRNPNWKWGGGIIRLSFDRSELNKIFKITPFKYNGFTEWEERIFSKKLTYIKPNLIIKIECSEEYYNIIKTLNNPNNIEIKLRDWKRVDAYGGRYILPHNDKRYNT